MTAKNIMTWVDRVFKSAWKRHRKTLSLLIIACFRGPRLSLTSLGRQLPVSTVPKHAIKRVDRFLGSRHFDHTQAREDWAHFVLGKRRQVSIAVDWTKVRSWPVLAAGLVQRGRTVPLLWSVADPKMLYKSQNAFEHAFFAWMASLLPDGVEATVLLDRGFKRVDIIRYLQRYRLSFVIRTGGNVHVHSSEYTGRMDKLISRRGVRKDLPDAVLRPSRPVGVRVVGYWAPGAKEPWLLMTDRSDALARIMALYDQRFRIEESFRDQKSWRYGMSLGHVLVHSTDRLERLLLIAAIVTCLAMLVGAAARRRSLDKGYRANTVQSRSTHSDFTLGIHYAFRLKLKRTEYLPHLLPPCRVAVRAGAYGHG